MLDSLVAVFGTLAGVLLSALVQQRGARSDRADQRGERRRSDVLRAVTALATAVADHRAAMWVREDARLSGAPADRVAALRDASHVTRSAITAPLVTLRVLAPALAVPADAAVTASYALRGAASAARLASARRSAIKAHDAFVTAAGVLIGGAA